MAFAFLGGLDAAFDVDYLAVSDVVPFGFGVSLFLGLLLNNGDVVTEFSGFVVNQEGQVDVTLVFGQFLEILFFEADADDGGHGGLFCLVIRRGRFCGPRRLRGPLDCWRAQCP